MKNKKFYNVKYNDAHHIQNIHDYDIDYTTNEIYLFGNEEYIGTVEEGAEPGVEFSMANKFIKNLNILMRKSDKPILIHLKTCGGDWVEGMAIHDAIKACPNEVVVINYTHARSMSSLIFLAADKRIMMEHSTFMFHEGTFTTSGTTKITRTEFEELEKTSEQMLDIYVEALKEKGSMRTKSKTFIRDWLIEQMNQKEDVYLSAKEAVKLGFADEIHDGSQWIHELTELNE